jgi:hypothetical protein
MRTNSKWLWRSHPFAGSSPDSVAILDERRHPWAEQLTSEEYIVADQAFYSLRQYYDRMIIPDTKFDREDSKKISAIRSIVEQGWSALKNGKSLIKDGTMSGKVVTN